MRVKSRKLEKALVLLGDTLLLYLAWKMAYHLRFDTRPFLSLSLYPELRQPWELYHRILMLILPLWLVFLHRFSNLDSLHLSHSYFKTLVEVGKAITLGSLAMLSASFLTKSYEYSRLILLLSASLSVFLITGYRMLVGWVLQRFNSRHREPTRVAVVGNGRVPEILRQVLSRTKGKAAIGYRFPIKPAYLIREVRKNRIGEVIFSSHPHGVIQMAPLIEECQKEGVDCKVVPDLLEFRMGEMVLDQSLGVPLFHIRSHSLEGVDFAFKRFFDISLSIILLVLLAIPLVLLALLIKLDSRGPVLYFQERAGYKGRKFWLWKFRTMQLGADEKLKDLLSSNERPGVAFKMKRDPRITPVGRFLRRFSIDELPQIVNVLKGDMSLVGPRPQVDREVETYDAVAWRRLSLLPGITGLWQVRGRAELSQMDMIALDLYYLENWSLALDLEILFKTLPVVLGGRGAY